MRYKELYKNLLEELWASAEYGLLSSVSQDDLILRLKNKFRIYSNKLNKREWADLKARLDSRGL